MIRNLKAFGLGVAAVFALTAVAASASFDGGIPFRNRNTKIEGTQSTNQVFKIAAGTVTCKPQPSPERRPRKQAHR